MVSAAFPGRPFNLRDNVWLISQDVAANTSRVGWQLWIDKTAYSPTFSGGIAHRWMKLNGSYVHEYYGSGFDFRNGNNFLIASGEATIPHNADGTKNLLIEAAANFDLLGATSLSATIGLPTIPRATTPNIAAPSTRDIGSAITINTPRASSSFTHTLKYSFAGATGTIATGVATSHSWTPPLSLLNQIPNSPSAVCTITCETYNGGTLIGTKTMTFTLAAGSAIVPTISSLTAVDANSSVATIVGAFVQGLSILQGTVNAAGVYGSTITASSFSMSGSTVASGGQIPVTASGSVPVGAAATDSRARTASFSGSLTVLPYAPPAITAVQVRRATAGGVVDEEAGTSLRVDLTAAVQSLLNGTERNSLQIKVFTRPRGGSVWTARNVISHGSLTYNSNFVVSGGANYPVGDSFEVQVQVLDQFVTATAQIDIATAAVFMHWSDAGIGVGKYHEQGALDVNGDGYFSGKVDADQGVFGSALTVGGVPALLRASSEVTDWDSVTAVGFYWSASTAANAPAARDLVGRVFVHGNGRIMQEVSDPTTTLLDLDMTWRRVWTGTSWTAWRLLGGGGYPDLDPFQPGSNGVTFATGWSNYTSSGWNGVWIARRAGIVSITGAGAKSSFSAGDAIVNVPAGLRPYRQAQGTNCQALGSPPSAINAGASGTTATSFSITYPVGA